MNDAYITDYDPLATAIWFKKPFEMGSFEMFVAHDEDYAMGDEAFEDAYGDDQYGSDRYLYGARLAFNFNENFSMAANYVKEDFYLDADWPAEGKMDVSTLWGDLIVNFNENIAFKGQYFYQDKSDGMQQYVAWSEDSVSAWKAVLQVSQDALKYTDLWVEYAQIDGGFLFGVDPYAWAAQGSALSIPGMFYDQVRAYAWYDTTVLNIVARQKWNDQWWTYLRYIDFDVDGTFWGYSMDYKGYTASVRYNYTPNLWFELGYDKIDSDGLDEIGWNDSMVWFRTTVNF
jgi:hypothetical protein